MASLIERLRGHVKKVGVENVAAQLSCSTQAVRAILKDKPPESATVLDRFYALDNDGETIAVVNEGKMPHPDAADLDLKPFTEEVKLPAIIDAEPPKSLTNPFGSPNAPKTPDVQPSGGEYIVSVEQLPQARVDQLRSIFPSRDLFVAFPCYKYTNPVTSGVQVALALDFSKDKMRWDTMIGDAMIYHARNKLADNFIASGAEWCLWIDDDIIPPVGRPAFTNAVTKIPENFPRELMDVHVVERLMSHGKTIVGGLYFGRKIDGAPMFAEALHDHEARRAARAYSRELRETDWVATGCLLTHRSVFLDIQKKFAGTDIAPVGTTESQALLGAVGVARKEWAYFQPEPNAGEDVAFCRRAKAAGHQVYVDLGCHCLHVGYASYSCWNTSNDNHNLL